MGVNAKVYMKQGADQQVIASGGDLLIEAGGTLSADAGAVTLESNTGEINAIAGRITTEALSTAAGAAATLTITNSKVAAGDIILLTRQGGTSDEGTEVMLATAGAGSFTVLLENRHASAAFDGTFIIGFLVVKMVS